MLAILLATILVQTPPPPTDEQAAAEAAASQIIARTEAERRCTVLGRAPGETISACTERRMTLRANGYTGGDPYPFTVTAMRRRCEDGSKTADESLTACIVRIIDEPASPSTGDSELRIETASVPRPDPTPEPQERCRRETVSDPDRGRAAVTWTCGDSESADAAKAMLDQLLP